MASFNICVGSYEAPQACSCSSEGVKVNNIINFNQILELHFYLLLHMPQCLPRFSLTSAEPDVTWCFLDVDGDRKPDNIQVIMICNLMT